MPIFYTSEGNKISYQVFGQGKPLLLVHGLGASQGFWSRVALRLLNYDYKFITYDLRGHGSSQVVPKGYTLESQASDLSALIDHLAIDDFYAVAHSFGGKILTEYALRFHQRIRKAVLLDTFFEELQQRPTVEDSVRHYQYVSSRFPLENRLTAELLDKILLLPVTDYRIGMLYMKLANKPCNVNATDRELSERLRLAKNEHDIITILSSIDKLKDTTASKDILSNISLDRLGLIETDLSSKFSMAYGEFSIFAESGILLQSVLKGSRLETIDAGGHFFPWFLPEPTTAMLLELLN